MQIKSQQILGSETSHGYKNAGLWSSPNQHRGGRREMQKRPDRHLGGRNSKVDRYPSSLHEDGYLSTFEFLPPRCRSGLFCISLLPPRCRSCLFCLYDADQIFSASRMPIKSFLPPRCRSSLFCFQDADQVFSVSRKPIKSFLPRSCWSSLSCLVDADHSTNALATIKRLTVYCQTFFLKYNILEGCAIHHEVITYSNAY